MAICKCNTEYNFFANGNMNGKAILVLDPEEEDFKGGRILQKQIGSGRYRRTNPRYEAYNLELLRVGFTLEYDFLILPSHYHPKPSKECYEHAMQTILMAGETRPVLVCSSIINQLADKDNWYSKIKLYATMIPYHDHQSGIWIMIIDGNITSNLGDFQFGFKRFAKFMKEVYDDSGNRS